MSEGRVATNADSNEAVIHLNLKPYTEERRRIDEALRRAHRAAPYDGRDAWGPVCSHCEWSGQAHKPCAFCEKGG